MECILNHFLAKILSGFAGIAFAISKKHGRICSKKGFKDSHESNLNRT